MIPIGEFYASVQEVVSVFHLQIRSVEWTKHGVKIRVDIENGYLCQFYYNELTQVTNYVLTGPLGRIYGRDCFDGVWHRHPFNNPGSHDFSSEGSRSMGPDEFLCEVMEWVLKLV